MKYSKRKLKKESDIYVQKKQKKNCQIDRDRLRRQKEDLEDRLEFIKVIPSHPHNRLKH